MRVIISAVKLVVLVEVGRCCHHCSITMELLPVSRRHCDYAAIRVSNRLNLLRQLASVSIATRDKQLNNYYD